MVARLAGRLTGHRTGRVMSVEEAEGWKQAALAFKKLVIKLEADVLMLQGKAQRVRVPDGLA